MTHYHPYTETLSILTTHMQGRACPTVPQLCDLGSLLLAGVVQKEELLKLGGLPRLLGLMEGQAVDADGAYAAAGCLACLAHHPKWLEEMTATVAATNKVRLPHLPPFLDFHVGLSPPLMYLNWNCDSRIACYVTHSREPLCGAATC